MAKFIKGENLLELEDCTILGALCKYITFEEHKKLNPINSNYGILRELELEKKYRKDKKYKAQKYLERSEKYLRGLNL